MIDKVKEAQQILKSLGLPRAQQNEMSALTLLALCDLKPNDKWKSAKRISKRVTKEIMAFVKENYKRKYAPNTRETFRRQVLHQLVFAGVVVYNPDNPDLPVNSPNAHYAISIEALNAIKVYGSKKFSKYANEFISKHNKLFTEIGKARKLQRIPITLEGKLLKLSPGKHNIIEVAVINQFGPNFAPGGKIVYLGDTEKKDFYFDNGLIKELKISFNEHGKLPDVIIYREDKDWLYLIEVVTSHGPVSPKRIIELEELFQDCKSGKIYVSAFPDLVEFKRHIANIAWETEVWIAETPEHLIHYNGDKFIGPR